MLRKPERFSFLCWIVGGFLLLLVVPITVRQSPFCPPQQLPNAGAIQTNGSPAEQRDAAQKSEKTAARNQQQSEDHKAGSASGNLQNSFPSFLCEETKITDWALVFFTYSLVIVGWFTMRSNERTLREIERAWIFPGVLDCKGSDEAPLKLKVSFRNIGRSPGIVMEVRVKFCNELPPVPEWSGSISQSYDWALPPTKRGITGEFTGNILGSQFCFGYVRYIDIMFNKPHHSRFAIRWLPNEEDERARRSHAGGEAYNSYD